MSDTIPRASSVDGHCHNPDDTITLNETDRHRRRIMMITDGGLSFLLDLPTARLLRHGEALILDDGRKIEVRAEPERLYKISGRDGAHLLALTWQIGNRHLAAQIGLDHVIIRHDPVIRDMLEGLGAVVEEVTAAFNPEGGAYDALPHSHDYGDEGDTEHHHAHG